MPAFRPPSVCPVCGEDVPPRAKSCPGCGACERTGWNPDGDSDGLDAEDDFDYDQFVADEFGGPAPRKSAKQWMWWVVAVVLLVAFVLVTFRR